MDKTTLIQRHCPQSTSKDSRNFFASALDKLHMAQQKHSPSATGFFSPEEQAEFRNLLQALPPHTPPLWLGGFPQAIRQVCFFPAPWQEELSPQELCDSDDMPLACLEGKCGASVGHRDVLGSLMGLGLSRRKIGDIVVLEELCQLVVLKDTASILLSQWETVGRQKISLREIPLTQLKSPEIAMKEITSTVASPRLDSMLSTGFSLSRTKASSLIASGKVQVNHREVTKADFTVSQEDLLSCRGLGNCKVLEIRGETRKGRILVCLGKYL